jgi:ribosomal protein L37AE/L43A
MTKRVIDTGQKCSSCKNYVGDRIEPNIFYCKEFDKIFRDPNFICMHYKEEIKK